MYPKAEIIEYAELLYILNERQELPQEYYSILNGGGTDGIPHFHLIFNQQTNSFVIWVRGTNLLDPNDIHINIQTTPVPFYYGQCHQGYYNAAMSIIDIMKNQIGNIQINKLVCLGHSLGGAASSVIAMILNKGDDANGLITEIDDFKDNINNIECFVFGTPPTFSSAMCIESRLYITNVILKNDIIPKLSGTFNALSILQKRLSVIWMYDANGLNDSNHARNALNNAFNLNVDDSNADKIPGKVFIIDDRAKRIWLNYKNYKNELRFFDILRVYEHKFYYYLQIIQIVDENDFTFTNDNSFIIIKKKTSLFKKFVISVGGIAVTGVTAYLTTGAAIAYGAISAIISS